MRAQNTRGEDYAETLELHVVVMDENDNMPVCPPRGPAISIPELSPPGGLWALSGGWGRGEVLVNYPILLSSGMETASGPYIYVSPQHTHTQRRVGEVRPRGLAVVPSMWVLSLQVPRWLSFW